MTWWLSFCVSQWGWSELQSVCGVRGHLKQVSWAYNTINDYFTHLTRDTVPWKCIAKTRKRTFRLDCFLSDLYPQCLLWTWKFKKGLAFFTTNFDHIFDAANDEESSVVSSEPDVEYTEVVHPQPAGTARGEQFTHKHKQTQWYYLVLSPFLVFFPPIFFSPTNPSFLLTFCPSIF